MSAELLSRLQFAVTIGFHFLFPPITIGLAWLLVIVETLAWWKRGRAGAGGAGGSGASGGVYDQTGRFFGKLLGLTFAVGVATGVVMEFQFGTNWSRYSRFVGDIFGAPLAAEGVFAFFLESSFLGVYLFARDRVSKPVHWLSALMVALGSTLSAFWIIVANSWMQTPAGFEVVPLRPGLPPWVPGTAVDPSLYRAHLTSFAAAVLNPSTSVRYHHTVTAAVVAGAFFMAGCAAWLLLKKKDDPVVAPVAAKALKLSLVVGLVMSVLVAFPFGHLHAQQVARTQPEKFAAMEGLYDSQSGAPLVMFALVKEVPPELRGKIEIPRLLSWMAFGDVHAQVRGIKDFPANRRPPLWITFVAFHNMVILGMYFIAATALGLWLWWRGRLTNSRGYLWLIVLTAWLPLAACQFGWVAAEVGRQPFAVYDLLRTADAFSAPATVTPGSILFSLVLFSVIYLLLFWLYVHLLLSFLEHAAEKMTPAAGMTPQPE